MARGLISIPIMGPERGQIVGHTVTGDPGLLNKLASAILGQDTNKVVAVAIHGSVGAAALSDLAWRRNNTALQASPVDIE